MTKHKAPRKQEPEETVCDKQATPSIPLPKHDENDAAIILLAYLVFSIIAAFALSSWQGGTAKIYVSYLIPQVLFVGCTLVYFRVRRHPIQAAMPLQKQKNPALFLFAIPITLGVFFQNIIFSTSFNWLLSLVGYTPSVTMPPLHTAGDYFLSALVLCLLPAIGEELVFRGVFLSAFSRHGKIKAMLFSSLAFSLIHLNPAQMVYQFIFGMVLSYLTLQTGSLIYASLVHFFSNLLAIGLPAIIPFFGALSPPSGTIFGVLALCFVLGSLVLYPSMYGLLRLSKEGAPKQSLRFFAFFRVKQNNMWYNEEGNTKKGVGVWYLALLFALVLTILISTLSATLPI